MTSYKPKTYLLGEQALILTFQRLRIVFQETLHLPCASIQHLMLLFRTWENSISNRVLLRVNMALPPAGCHIEPCILIWHLPSVLCSPRSVLRPSPAPSSFLPPSTSGTRRAVAPRPCQSGPACETLTGFSAEFYRCWCRYGYLAVPLWVGTCSCVDRYTH